MKFSFDRCYYYFAQKIFFDIFIKRSSRVFDRICRQSLGEINWCIPKIISHTIDNSFNFKNNWFYFTQALSIDKDCHFNELIIEDKIITIISPFKNDSFIRWKRLGENKWAERTGVVNCVWRCQYSLPEGLLISVITTILPLIRLTSMTCRFSI